MLSEYAIIGNIFTAAGGHSMHHDHSDGKFDIISPYRGSGNNVISRIALRKIKINDFNESDWVKSTKIHQMHMDKLQHDWKADVSIPNNYKEILFFISTYGLDIHLITIAFLGILNPIYLIFLYGIPTIMSGFIGKMVHTFGHIGGDSVNNLNNNNKFPIMSKLLLAYKNYDIPNIENKLDHSVNTPLLYPFYGGEIYHNNHHKYPNAYHYNVMKNEYDINAWVIRNFLAKPSSLQYIKDSVLYKKYIKKETH